MPIAPCLKIHKTAGEETLSLVGKLELLDKSLQIQRGDADFLFVPLIREPNENEFAFLKEQIPELQLTTLDFVKKKLEETLAESLADQLPPHLVASLPRSIDMIGDIAIIEIPHEFEGYKKILGEAILRVHKNTRVVLAKAGAVSGVYRLRKFEFIGGEHRTSTVYRENGCSYHVDVAKTYFSPRLSHEHQRVASLVKNGETVVDLFAGVGPFSVLVARNNPDGKIYAIDVNPDAVDVLEKNIRFNRVENRVYPIVGDARQIVGEKLSGVADRVIMNLPEKAIEFVDVACRAIKPSGGIVHFYGFVRLPDKVSGIEQSFSEAVKKFGRKVVAFLDAREVRETAPFEWQVVLDAEVL